MQAVSTVRSLAGTNFEDTKVVVATTNPKCSHNRRELSGFGDAGRCWRTRIKPQWRYSGARCSSRSKGAQVVGYVMTLPGARHSASGYPILGSCSNAKGSKRSQNARIVMVTARLAEEVVRLELFLSLSSNLTPSWGEVASVLAGCQPTSWVTKINRRQVQILGGRP